MMHWFEPLEGKDLVLRQATNRGIWLLVAVFVILGTVYSVVTPLFEASDELWHYPFVKHLADGHGLPVQDPANQGPWCQEGSQPPLYYVLGALVSCWVPSDDLSQWQHNPHADIGTLKPDGNANMLLHTSREAFPYRGAALAVHLVRGLSVLLSALTVLFAYGLGLEVLPRRPELALAGAAVVAFTPMFLFIAGSVNNDNLLVPLSTIAVWYLIRLLRLPSTPWRWILLGLLIGLAALAKVSGLALLPLAALGLAWTAWRRRDWKLFLWGGACIIGAAMLVAGWWYYRNWRLYGDPLGWNVFVAIAGPRSPSPTPRQLLSEWQGFVMAYWGLFGGLNVAAPAWFYHLLNAVALLGAAGLIAWAIRRLRQRRFPDLDTVFRVSLMALWPLIVLAGLIRWTLLTTASQGRLIFPAIASLSYLLVLGMAGWDGVLRETLKANHLAPEASRQRDTSGRAFRVSLLTSCVLPFTPSALLLILALWIPFGVIAPAYARPALLTPAEQMAIPNRLDVLIGDGMELLGYEIAPDRVQPGDNLAVTLYWRARAPMALNYSVFVHLIDDIGVITAQRDLYPGRGAFPTTLWRPGDAIADTYVIPIPSNTFVPGRLQIEAGLYVLESGKRLPVRDREGHELGDSVRVGDVAVYRKPGDGLANPTLFDLEHRAALVGYDLDRRVFYPGETLPLSLFWRALAPLGPDHAVFIHLLDGNGRIWGGKGARLTGDWPVGQITQKTYGIVLPADTPEGVYYVTAGLYLTDSLRRLNLLDRWGHAQGDRAVLTRIRVLPPPPPERLYALPPVQHPLDIAFDNLARLEGFALGQTHVNPNEPLRLTLYWQAINAQPYPVSLAVFAHLLSLDGRIVAQHDGIPAASAWPTTAWVQGQVIVDPHDLAFNDSGYTGMAVLRVGLYDPVTMKRLVTSKGEDSVLLPVQITVRH